MTSPSIVQFLNQHLTILSVRLLQHLYLSISATLIAVIIGVPLGILITHHARLKSYVLGTTSVFQTIPSLALLAFLIPFLGIGIKPTIIALTIYALLPITRNTFTGLNTVPADSLEAATGLGFNRWQKLWLVELPLALPVIVAGIRTATAMTVGITTIAAFIGAGGLGDFITQGLELNNTRLILLGAIPVALLALFLDYIISIGSRLLNKRKRQNKMELSIFFAMPIILTGLCSLQFITRQSRHYTGKIVIATKNFTEQFILGNLMADLISAKTHLRVIKKFNLGTVLIVQNALEKGEIDLYPGYTGTAYMVVLHHHKVLSAKKTFAIVKQQYKKRYQLIWLHPFGYNSSETLAVRETFSKKYHLHNLSQLAALSRRMPLAIAANAAFIKRPDSLPGLTRVYHFHFHTIIQMQHDLAYSAIIHHIVPVIQVFRTDGRLAAFHLVALKDNKHFYPPYYAAPVIRAEILKKYPHVRTVLAQLDGRLTEKIMQRLNYDVDIQHLSPAAVAKRFLIQQNLL